MLGERQFTCMFYTVSFVYIFPIIHFIPPEKITKPKGSSIFQRELKCYTGKIRVKLKAPVDSFVKVMSFQRLTRYQNNLLSFM